MLQKLRQLDNLTVKFLIVGSIGFVANYLALFLCTHQLGLNKVLGEVIAVAFALQITFLLHDHWTYRHNRRERDDDLWVSLPVRYVLYMASNAFSAISTIIIFSVLIHFIKTDLIALGLAAILQTIWNYVFNKTVIWRHAHHTAQP